MAKIGLVDVDSHNFPNLALMKISKYHKNIGDSVSFVTIGNYDKIYMSKVFSFTNNPKLGFVKYNALEKGGTGYDLKLTLQNKIDKLPPDYSLYPQNKHAYGFLTRGCPNKCYFCIVPKKEGKIKKYSDIEDFLEGRDSAILMDNNVLAHKHGLKQIEKIIKLGIKIDFNQGLDSRLIDSNVAKLLSKVKWINYLRTACDSENQISFVEKALMNLKKYGINSNKIFIYVLVKDIESGLKIVEYFRKIGYIGTFAQPFRDFKNNIEPSYELKKFARWCNRKQIFAKTTWENYKQRKIEIYK